MNLFSEIPKEEFLEAVISAMRSVLQQLASKSIPQVQKLPNIGHLYVILKGDYSVLRWSVGVHIQGAQSFRLTLK